MAEEFIGLIDDYARIELSRAVVAGLESAARGTGKYLTELARVLRSGTSANQRKEAHRTIARRAQQAVLNSYAQTVTRRKQVPSYRANEGRHPRYAQGALRSALGAADFYEVDARGIDFVNTRMLDERAAHWARLNAGAAPRGTGSRKRFEVRFSGLVVAAIGIDMTPSPGFNIPRGYWWDPATGQPVAPGGAPAQFYLRGSGPRSGATSFTRGGEGGRRRVPLQTPRRTAGIQARNFLDTGAQRIALDIGPVYERMYRDLFNKGIATVRPQRIRATVGTRTIQTSL